MHSLAARMFIEAINATYDAVIEVPSDQLLIGDVTGTTRPGESYFDVSPDVMLRRPSATADLPSAAGRAG